MLLKTTPMIYMVKLSSFMARILRVRHRLHGRCRYWGGDGKGWCHCRSERKGYVIRVSENGVK